MQTVYLHDSDRARLYEVEYRIKRAACIPGRVELPLITKVGLRLLEREMEDRKAETLEFIEAMALKTSVTLTGGPNLAA